jgi:hypothetical protein
MPPHEQQTPFLEAAEISPRTWLPILEYANWKFLVEMHQTRQREPLTHRAANIAIYLNWPVMFPTVGFFAFWRRLLLKSDCVVFLR